MTDLSSEEQRRIREQSDQYISTLKKRPFTIDVQELVVRILTEKALENKAEYHRGRCHELTEGDWVRRVEELISERDELKRRVESLEAALKDAKSHITNALSKLPTDHLLPGKITLEPVRKSLNQACDSLSRLTGAPKEG